LKDLARYRYYSKTFLGLPRRSITKAFGSYFRSLL